MWFLPLIPLFSSLIDKIFPNKAEADKAKLELEKALSEAQQKIIDSQKEVIVTEMSTGNWAGQWRAYLMMICVAIVGYNWIFASLLNAFLKPLGCPIDVVPVPPELWTLVTVGLGGYLGKEAISNYSENKYQANDKRFYDVLREKLFKSGLTEADVGIFNEALKARDGK